MSEPLRVNQPAPEGEATRPANLVLVRASVRAAAARAAIGREIARTFLLALRSFHSHGARNQIAVAAVKSLVQALNQGVRRHGRSELRVVEDFLYFGPQRLRLPRSDERMVGIVVQEFASRGIGSISLSVAATAGPGQGSPGIAGAPSKGRPGLLSQIVRRDPAGGLTVHAGRAGGARRGPPAGPECTSRRCVSRRCGRRRAGRSGEGNTKWRSHRGGERPGSGNARSSAPLRNSRKRSRR